MKRLVLLLAAVLALPLSLSPAQAWQADNGDGTYANPPLNADYPDPDIIRVGDDFYFATTTFANSPGLRVLHSRDLVNWRIAGHVLPRLDGGKAFDLEGGNVYRRGVFAPSLRHHGDEFILAFTMVGQNTRICRAKLVEGPWRCHSLDRAAFDPGLFFDTDGRGYIATSVGSDGTITLLSLNAELTRVTDARKVHYIAGAEGSKLIRRGDWYYLFNAVPRCLCMTISRARQLQGPWETTPSINTASTGGHQGAIVDLADGRWWGFVMQDKPAIGRITNLSPIFWKDDWPVWGTPEEPGRVPARATKPVQGQPVQQPATSDEFDEPKLGLQWAWNHNPDDTRWSLTERPGWLRLKATRADGFWTARNTLTQKGQGPYSRQEVKLDLRGLSAGDRCGLGTLGKVNAGIAAVRGEDGALALERHTLIDNGSKPATTIAGPRTVLSASEVALRLEMDFERARGTLSWQSPVGWQALGDEFNLVYDWATGTFQGPQVSLFCFNTGRGAAGHLDVDWFHFSDKRPGTNPPIRDRFTADPAPLVVGDTVYLYVGHDEAKGADMFRMNEWLVYSSKDLKTWTPHGPIMKPTDFKWAVRDAWAAQVVQRDGRYWLYATVHHDDSKPGKAIGVAVADSPLGPFKDSRGSALISEGSTPSPYGWDDIDPTVFVDDDGSAWLAWGNPVLYLVKLKSNMTELAGTITKVALPNYTEGPWISKRNGVYYLTYAAMAHQGVWEHLAYATAPSMAGPWTYGGILTGPANKSYTIHPGLINDFKGSSYLVYHNASLTLPDGQSGAIGRRAVAIDYLHYNADGSMQPVKQTEVGISIPPAPSTAPPAKVDYGTSDAGVRVKQLQQGYPSAWPGKPVIASVTDPFTEAPEPIGFNRNGGVTTLAQTFVATRDITVGRLSFYAGDGHGTSPDELLRLSLREEEGGAELLGLRFAYTPQGAGLLELDLPAVTLKAGRRYVLEVQGSKNRLSAYFRASRRDVYKDGEARIDGKPLTGKDGQPADFAFALYAR